MTYIASTQDSGGYWSIVWRVTSLNGDRVRVRLWLGPNPKPNVVVDLRNKAAVNSFSYVHTVMPFRNLDQWPFGLVNTELLPTQAGNTFANCSIVNVLALFSPLELPSSEMPNAVWRSMHCIRRGVHYAHHVTHMQNTWYCFYIILAPTISNTLWLPVSAACDNLSEASPVYRLGPHGEPLLLLQVVEVSKSTGQPTASKHWNNQNTVDWLTLLNILAAGELNIWIEQFKRNNNDIRINN